MNTSTIKTVYGYHNPTENRRVELIRETKQGNFYVITAKDDRGICLEVDSILYRVFREDQKAGFDAIDNGTIVEMIQKSNLETYKKFLSNKDVKHFANATFFAMACKMDFYKHIEDNNKRLDKLKEEEEQLKQAEADQEQKEDELKELVRFNEAHPMLNEYKKYLLSVGKTSRSIGATYKALQRLTNVRDVISSRACWLALNIDVVTVDVDKNRFYLDTACTAYIDIDTKAQLNFALWLKSLED